MARSPSIVADSEGNAGDAPDDASMKDVANGEESGEEEEEYEIELILKHNRGQFPAVWFFPQFINATRLICVFIGKDWLFCEMEKLRTRA